MEPLDIERLMNDGLTDDEANEPPFDPARHWYGYLSEKNERRLNDKYLFVEEIDRWVRGGLR